MATYEVMPRIMRKTIIGLFALCGFYLSIAVVFSSYVREEEKEQYDFRKAKWGMTGTQVRDSEYPLIIDNSPPGHQLYHDKITDKKVDIIYRFDEGNKLVSGMMVFVPENFPSITECMSSFTSVREAISRKYTPLQRQSESLGMISGEHNGLLYESPRSIILLENECQQKRRVTLIYRCR